MHKKLVLSKVLPNTLCHILLPLKPLWNTMYGDIWRWILKKESHDDVYKFVTQISGFFATQTPFCLREGDSQSAVSHDFGNLLLDSNHLTEPFLG